jgi:hypothetical protein
MTKGPSDYVKYGESLLLRQSNQLVFISLVLGSGAASLAQAQSVSCAHFEIHNESYDVKKEALAECQALKPVFNLSQCLDTRVVNSAKVECHGDSATATITTQTTKYEVPLKRFVGEKNNSLWDTVGPIKQIKLVSREKKIVTVVPKKPDRAPAAVIGTNEAQQTKAAQASLNPAPTATPVAVPTSAPLATPAAPVNLIPPTLSISGMFDAYYAQNFNHTPAVTTPSSTSPGLPNQQNSSRNFDLYNNQFALNLAELTIKNTMKETTLLVDLDFGQQADYIAKQDSGSTATTDSVSKNIGQAILTYSPSSHPGLSFSVGKMDTNMGYETPKAINNWQYSRSFLFSYGIPYWHMGASVTDTIVPDLFTASAFVYNGWNTLYNDNSGHTFALQLALTPNKNFSFVYNGIEGPEHPEDISDITQVHEMIATFNASSKVQMASDTIYGWAGRAFESESDAHWWASSFALKYQVLPLYSISPRLEFYRDADGYTTGTVQDLTSVTLTQATKLPDGIEPRLELRWDHSSAGSFQSGVTTTKKDQLTLLIAALYSF